MNNRYISLEQGNGGEEMDGLLSSLLSNLYRGDKWSDFTNDSATYPLPNGDTLCFTTDSFVVDPIKFPGGNIGHLAVSGTINDLCVMGADAIGLSLSLIIEEGFEKDLLDEIIESANKVSKESAIPIVTGDTKVMPKGSLDKIVINVSGVGIAKRILDKKIAIGDKIIISGGIGEHGIALLSKRFDFQTQIISDSKPLHAEMRAVRDLAKFAKDPTRGGIAAILNEIAEKKNLSIEIEQSAVPIKKEVRVATELLGLDPLELANEGKVLLVVSGGDVKEVLSKLREFNDMAQVIGEIRGTEKKKGEVVLKTPLGSRILPAPSGKIVPRIC